jgi:hypothetical protein
MSIQAGREPTPTTNLASVRGTNIATESAKSNIRKRSAFCDGGNVEELQEQVLKTSRPSARVKRMGRMVNVYKKESKHRMKPKPMICTK